MIMPAYDIGYQTIETVTDMIVAAIRFVFERFTLQ